MPGLCQTLLSLVQTVCCTMKKCCDKENLEQQQENNEVIVHLSNGIYSNSHDNRVQWVLEDPIYASVDSVRNSAAGVSQGESSSYGGSSNSNINSEGYPIYYSIDDNINNMRYSNSGEYVYSLASSSSDVSDYTYNYVSANSLEINFQSVTPGGNSNNMSLLSLPNQDYSSRINNRRASVYTVYSLLGSNNVDRQSQVHEYVDVLGSDNHLAQGRNDIRLSSISNVESVVGNNSVNEPTSCLIPKIVIEDCSSVKRSSTVECFEGCH